MQSKNSEAGFVVCIRNDDCGDLEVRKVYEVLPDERAAEDDYIRVIDESGEDYLYPESYFCPVDLPSVVQETFRLAA